MTMNLNSIHVIITLLSCASHVISGFQCLGTCYSGSFPKNNQITKGKHLRGYSYKNITTDVPRTCFWSCVNDCRCKAFQMKDVRCELLDEDMACKNYIDDTGYVFYDLQQTFYKGNSHMVHPAGVCYNGCCRSQPCMNGGTCVEHCENPKVKFSCKCPQSHFGKVCQTKKEFRSCIDVLKNSLPGTMPANGTYIITRSDTYTNVPVYCAFESPNQAWTLLESFSLENNDNFTHKAFYQNVTRSQKCHNWNDYRLSLSNMKYIQTKATMFRATCDYQNRDSLTPDYLLGYKKNFDIFDNSTEKNYFCANISYANFKGSEFRGIEMPLFQVENVFHLHIDYSWGLCGFKPNETLYIRNEDTFGEYRKINTATKCTATLQSTTQWWLGEQQ